jgi:hypothetical protein
MLELAGALLVGLGVLWALRPARRERPDYTAIDRMELDLGLRERQPEDDIVFGPGAVIRLDAAQVTGEQEVTDHASVRRDYILREIGDRIGDYDPDGCKSAYLTEVGLRFGRHKRLTGITS